MAWHGRIIIPHPWLDISVVVVMWDRRNFLLGLITARLHMKIGRVWKPTTCTIHTYLLVFPFHFLLCRASFVRPGDFWLIKKDSTQTTQPHSDIASYYYGAGRHLYTYNLFYICDCSIFIIYIEGRRWNRAHGGVELWLWWIRLPFGERRALTTCKGKKLLYPGSFKSLRAGRRSTPKS